MTQFEFDNLMNNLRQEQEKTTEKLHMEISELEERRSVYKTAIDNAKAEYKKIGLEISQKSAEIKEINADFHNRKKALIIAFPKAQGTQTEGNSRHRSRCFGIRQTIIDTIKDIFKDTPNVNADDINVKFDIAEGESTTFTVIIRKDGNLHDWSERMQGARIMLEAIIESVRESKGKFLLDNAGHDSQVYHDAIVRLILSSLDNTQNFLLGRRIGYTNHKKDKKGKLIYCDAYFLNQ